MPHQPTITETRINNIIIGLKPAVTLLNEIHDAFGTPFVQAISNTTLSLITIIQNVKKNKDECIQLMESIYQVLYGIVNLHIVSETAGSLPPTVLNDLGKFTEYGFSLTTLKYMMHTFVEAQHDGNRIKSFFRQTEMNTLLKECQAGVKHALEMFKASPTMFKLKSGASNLVNIREMQNTADNMHRNLLEMISTLSDGASLDGASSMHQTFNGSQISSQSFSMLPAKPKIFHGRDTEVKEIVLMLTQNFPSIAILGPGGMGKTSLAKAALHHPNIAAKYTDRFFVPCDSATTSVEIASLIGAHLGLKPVKNPVKPAIQCLAKKAECLLILDNLETTWEPLASRPGVEELLSLLTGLPHLALIITMRGAERPAKVAWTRPFLPPLKPLSTEAAREMFVDITDVHAVKEIDQILRLTDNMPLAVDLIAHLVDYDGCASVLSRWETEKTTFLSKGHDRHSNLDISIGISLSSPRLTSVPGALDLLGLLSILPDGLSDAELRQSKLPIRDVLGCKAALLGTSLAFSDDKNRLQSLVPIREHMQYFHPVPSSLVQPLQEHFHKLLNLYRIYQGSLQATSRINQITLNLGNLHHVLLHGLQAEKSDLSDTINCILFLNNFTRTTGYGPSALMDQIPHVLPKPCNHRLEVEYIIEVLRSRLYQSVEDPEILVSQAISHFQHFYDPILKCRFYHISGYYYAYHARQVAKGMELLDTSLRLAKSTSETRDETQILIYMAHIKSTIGEYSAGQTLSVEAQRLAKLTANLSGESRALLIEAVCLSNLGDYKNTFPLLDRGRKLLKLCGMSDGILDRSIWNEEAEIHMLKSEYTEARAIYFQISQDASADLDIYNYATSLVNIGMIGVFIGQDMVEVQNTLEKAITLYNDVKYSFGVNNCEIILADLNLREGSYMTAKAMFQKCLKYTWAIDTEGTSYCLERMADVNRWSPADLKCASTYAVLYLAFAKKHKQKHGVYKALQSLGQMFLANGDEGNAESLFLVALEGFTYMDVHCSRAQCMLSLGDIAKLTGDQERAASLWAEARPLFNRSLQSMSVAQIDVRLADLEVEKGTQGEVEGTSPALPVCL
ncbi:hypothetical protein B0H11DRAFT_2195851 [Mycena galericulata]|nr:hypothetical protein B0H11DRAFT_2195851 [Mycena galericulata]